MPRRAPSRPRITRPLGPKPNPKAGSASGAARHDQPTGTLWDLLSPTRLANAWRNWLHPQPTPPPASQINPPVQISPPVQINPAPTQPTSLGVAPATLPATLPAAGPAQPAPSPKPIARAKEAAPTKSITPTTPIEPAPPRPMPALGTPVTMAERYEAMTRHVLAETGIRVRRWRTNSSGVAWCVTYRDGRVVKLIESPKPTGPMSAAIFLHEVGHHHFGIGAFKPRCLEEYHAWAYSLEAMERYGLNVTDAVRRRMHRSLHYAIKKAQRRGLKELPKELEPYATAWVDNAGD